MRQLIKKQMKNEKGLTLIELLAVIVILGIIAAIAVPSIGSIIQKSREDAVKADAITILNAAKNYVAANGIPEQAIPASELTTYVSGVDASFDSYTVSVSDDGTTFGLTATDVTAGNITIDFNDATIEQIDSSNKGAESIPPASTDDDDK